MLCHYYNVPGVCAFLHCSQNGYPSRRRSLVDDARFETIVVKQTKQSVLEEAREKANGKSASSLAMHPLYVIDPYAAWN